MTASWPPSETRLTPGKRVLFLTKDLELIHPRPKYGEYDSDILFHGARSVSR